MFKRKKRAALDSETGIYIFDDGQVLRLLLVGNAPLLREFTIEHNQFYSALVAALQTNAHTYYSALVRVYPNYVALSKWAGTAETESLLHDSLKAIQKHLGWDTMTILGRITTLEEFRQLHEKHGRRWPLGRY